MKEKLVLYHGSCYDGFGAAFAAWKRMGDEADYRSVAYNTPIPEDAKNYKQVFIVDFSYPKKELIALADVIEHQVVVLDHHKTAMEQLQDLVHPKMHITFDMTRSGAGIAWNYFCFGPPPDLIRHIQDRDLWKFELEGSKEIHAALVSYPFDFEVWNKFDVESLKTEGKALLRMYDQLVEKICAKPWMVKIAGYEVPAINTTIAWSEVGHYLIEKYPDAPFVASFTEFEDCTMWSLRSKESFDVGVVAKQFGGGGHKNAAGFKIFKGRIKEFNP